jgi:hypothetical protein
MGKRLAKSKPTWADVKTNLASFDRACKWTNSTEGWLDSADETAAMIARGSPCHQYFSDRHGALGHADSVTIEIAYME